MRGQLQAGKRAASPLSHPGVTDGFWGSQWGGMPLAAALTPWASQLVGKINPRVGVTSRAAAGHPHTVPAAMLWKGLGETLEKTRSSHRSFIRGHPCWKCA